MTYPNDLLLLLTPANEVVIQCHGWVVVAIVYVHM
jgi:hypothetical protein